MLRPSTLSAVASLALGLGLCFAQTYTPKQIKLQGAEGSDTAEIQRILALKPGTPTTKAEIEAALQRLADTGLFSDLSYAVNADVLSIVLKPVEGNEILPVRFSNFVWWNPSELENLVEARVPLYHGKLSTSGQLTNQVSAALAALLAEKGILDAKITAGISTPAGTNNSNLVLSLAQPSINVGEIKLSEDTPELQKQLAEVTARLASHEFDVIETSSAIRNTIANTYQAGGFLEATVDPPIFAVPRKDMFGYAMDASVVVHPGALYHAQSVDLRAVPPVTQTELDSTVNLHVGETANPSALQIAQANIAQLYQAHGYLEAHIQAVATLNKTNHTVAYRFSINPGALDHLAAIDTSALPSEQQEQFKQAWRGTPGMEAGVGLADEVFRTVQAIGANKDIHVMQHINLVNHTVTLIFTSAKGSK